MEKEGLTLLVRDGHKKGSWKYVTGTCIYKGSRVNGKMLCVMIWVTI